MITESIFDWAIKTPDRTAVIHNGQALSYRAFAQLISMARGYFALHEGVGPGYAVLAVHNLMDFWILSLALRSLGLTTIAVPSAAAIQELGLPKVSCVVTSPAENWPGLERLCAARSLKLLSVSLKGEPALGLGTSTISLPPGGHILRTSGTTGISKNVLMMTTTSNHCLRTLFWQIILQR